MHLLTDKIFALSQIWALYKGTCQPTKCNVINAVKLFPTKTCGLLTQISNFIESDVTSQLQVH